MAAGGPLRHAGGVYVPDSPAALAAALRSTGYLTDDGLATATFLAMRMGRPLFCEGEPGTGKTALAQALAQVTGAELIRLQCHDGIDASQALYDWDFPRQLLHLRALEAAAAGDRLDVEAVEHSLYDPKFLLARPILRALQTSPSVLLVDEIDRADDEFEAFLLEVLTEHAVTIPEIGEIRAVTSRRWWCSPPTAPARCTTPSNAAACTCGSTIPTWRARSRSCTRGCPGLPERLAAQVAGAVRASCARPTCSSPPASPRRSTGRARCSWSEPGNLDVDSAAATLGAVLKYREDADRIRDQLDALLAS